MKNRRAILSILILSAASVGWPASPARCQDSLEDFFARFRSINRLTEENLSKIKLHRWKASPQLVESTRQNIARLRESFRERSVALESELKASPDGILGSIKVDLELSNITDALGDSPAKRRPLPEQKACGTSGPGCAGVPESGAALEDTAAFPGRRGECEIPNVEPRGLAPEGRSAKSS